MTKIALSARRFRAKTAKLNHKKYKPSVNPVPASKKDKIGRAQDSEAEQPNQELDGNIDGENARDCDGLKTRNTTEKSEQHSVLEDPLIIDNMHEGANSLDHSKSEKEKWDPENYPAWLTYRWRKKVPGDDDFEVLLRPLLDQDTKQCNVWKEEVQNILILAGLFSAVVTAFIIESYQTLRPDPNDEIISLLGSISGLMTPVVGNASSHGAPPPSTPTFMPTPSDIRINILWFISLVLSLSVALIGIITLQWLREHQRYETGMEVAKLFAVFNARADGLKRWYVPQIFTGLPLLLQAALILFFGGLVEFLFAIHIEVAIPVAVAVSIPILFLAVTTLIPTFQLCTIHAPYLLRVNHCPPAPCPYKSPQALLFQRATIVSGTFFKVFTRIFSALWSPCVAITRVFSKSNKPFYGKSAPFSTDEYRYQYFCDRLRSAAGNWMSMDTQWLATRTSYAVAMQTPITARHFRWPYVSDGEFTNVIDFYDCVDGIKDAASGSDPANDPYRQSLYNCVIRMFSRLADAWKDPVEATLTDPEAGKALQGHLTALLTVTSPYGHQQIETLLGLCQGDMDVVYNVFFAVLIDQALGHEFDFDHKNIHLRLQAHIQLTRLYLSNNVLALFLCSNDPGVTPSLSLSTRSSFAHHRKYLERSNPSWMTRKAPIVSPVAIS